MVIPNLFPAFKGDLKGIFILDYIRAVQSICNISVLHLQIQGQQKGFYEEDFNGVRVFRYVVSKTKSKISAIKILRYSMLFFNGIRYAKDICKDIDIIHVHDGTVSGTIARVIKKKYKIPYVVTEHTGPFSKISSKKFSHYLCKKAMEKSNAVLTVSNDLKLQIQSSCIRPKKFYVTFNPIDTELFNLAPLQRKKENIIYVGRLENYKGGKRSLLAFQNIVAKYPTWKLTIIGDGPDLNSMEQIVREDSRLSKQVSLKGSLDKKAISKAMDLASFFVFPSEHETFGIVIGEAMAKGLPVIVGNETAPKEFVDKDSGVLIPPRDIDAISKSMARMIEDFSNYDPVAIRRKVVENFGFENFGQRLKQIYTECI